MKTYKFKVEMELPKSKGSFLDGIENEISDEARQLELSQKINRKASDMHLKMLQDIVKLVNKEIASLGVSFTAMKYKNGSNEYVGSFAIIQDLTYSGNTVPFIGVRQHAATRDFADSIYSTYTGKEYEVRVGTVKNWEAISINAHNTNGYKMNNPDSLIDDILKELRLWFKKYMIASDDA